MEWKDKAAMVTKSRTEMEQILVPQLKQPDPFESFFFLSGGQQLGNILCTDWNILLDNTTQLGQWCGTVDIDTSGPRFDSSFIGHLITATLCRKVENKENETGNGPLETAQLSIKVMEQSAYSAFWLRRQIKVYIKVVTMGMKMFTLVQLLLKDFQFSIRRLLNKGW